MTAATLESDMDEGQTLLWGGSEDLKRGSRGTYTAAVKKYRSSNRGKAAAKRRNEKCKHDKYGTVRAYRRKRRLKEFGLTPETYHAMLVSQEWKCAICHEVLVEMSDMHWPVDHCHKTGKVRGIVHPKCNALVGWLEKNERLLPSAHAYIRRHRRDS